MLLVDTTGQDTHYPSVAANDAGQFLVAWHQENSSTDYDVHAVRVAAATGAVTGSTIGIDTGSGKDQRPAVTAISSTQYLVVWAEYGYRMDARRVGSDGSLPGTPLTKLDSAYVPQVVWGGSQALAVWEDYQTAGEYMITGQRISDADATVGGLIYVSPYYTVREHVDVAYHAGAGEYLLAWEQAYASPNEDVLVQRVDEQGLAVGDPVNLTGDAGAAQEQPRIAAGEDTYLAVWQDWRNESTTGVDIYGHLLDSSGALSGTVIAFAVVTYSQRAPAVAYNSERDEYLAAWYDYRNSGTGDSDIFAHIAISDGSLRLTDPISIVVDGYQGDLDVAYNPDQDTYLIVWEDERPGTDDSDVYGQVVSGTGALSGSSFEISGANDDQVDPAVAYNDAAGVFLVTWWDKRDGSQWDVYGQVVSGTDGSLSGSNFAVSSPSSGTYNYQEYPDVVARSGDQTDEFVVVWQDRRNDSDRDIYLQRVDGDGSLLDEPDTGADETDPTVNLPVAVDSGDYYERPAVAYSPDDDVYLVAWSNLDDGGIQVQRYASITPTVPTASFDAAPTGGVVPLTVVFSDTSTGQAGEWGWDFGDQSLGTGAFVEHTYIATGTFTVTLAITNPGGSDSATMPITVTEQVTPSLDEDWEGYEVDDEPQFWMDHESDGTARTEFRVLLAGANRAFGTDYEAGTNLFSSYALPGVASWQDYEVRGRLQRTDANGGLGVVVYSRYPAGESKMYMLSYWPGGSFTLEDHGTGVLVEGDLDAGVVPATSTWYRFRVQAATHDDRVTLRAKVWVDGETEPTLWQAVGYDDGAGCITAGSVGVHEYDDGEKYFDDLVVEPLGIQSDFSGSPITGTAPHLATFVADPIGEVVTYTWRFGDGSGPSVTAVPTATHTYVTSGTYDVGLTVEGPAGNDTYTRTNYITITAGSCVTPPAGFSGSPLSGTAPLTVTFSDASSGTVDGRLWTFGDGGTSTATDPSHTYTQTGVYTVSLAVSATCGSDVLTRTDYVTVSSSGGGYTTTTTVITYTYDFLNRLTEADYSTGASFEYKYDAVGNREAMTTTAETVTYTYDIANRLTAVGGVSYTYDDNGNLTHDGVYTYTWNAAGRMIGAESVTHTMVYTYNGDGVRVAQSVDGQLTTWVQDQGSSLAQVLLEVSGGQTTAYLLGLGRLAQVEDGTYEWFLGDALGSVRQVVDDNGDVLLSRDYSPFGQLLSESGTGSSGYGYTGEQVGAGLVFLRARYYSPSLGRFISVDPFPGYARVPQTLHPYAYCLNNAINCTDPSGEFPPPWLEFVAGAGYQYANDIMLGAPDLFSSRVQSSLDILGLLWRADPMVGLFATRAYAEVYKLGIEIQPCGAAYESGRRFGRALSTSQAILETVGGLITIAGSVTLGPPLDIVAAAAGGGALSWASGSAAVAVNVGALEAGGALVTHGAGVLAYNVGNPIDKPDDLGRYPDWDTVRSRYWKNRAASGADEFSAQNIGRMRQGSAPVARIRARMNDTGEVVEMLVSKELHHIGGRSGATPHATENLVELWPWEHAAKDPQRYIDYRFLGFE